MAWLRRARAAAGFLAVVTLLGLFVAEFTFNGDLDEATVRVLLALIAALLGLDKITESLPLQIEISGSESAENGDENN